MKINLAAVWGTEFKGEDLTTKRFSCKTVTPSDLNATRTASEVIIASGAGMFYLALFLLSVLGVWSTCCARLCSSRGTFFLFLIGALLASVNVFTYADNLVVKLYFRLFITTLIGIAYTLFGAFLFFSLPDQGADRRTLGDQQPSMGCVVVVVTFPLFLLETILLAFTFTKGAENAIKRDCADPSEKAYVWILLIAEKIALLLQKPIQLGMYLYLRTTCLRMQEYKGNAEFYLKILSFFNFIEWIDAQVNVKNDVHSSGLNTKDLDGWFDVFVLGYKALIIDYRLLCCLLFLEHSAEIPDDNQHPEAQGHEQDTINCMTPRDRLKEYSGFLVACLCLTAPVLCGLHYIKSLGIGAFVQIFAIIVNTAITAFAAWFLYMNELRGGQISESLGIKIMVCCLGAIGVTCWIVEAALVGYWATAGHKNDVCDPPLMRWDAPKFVVRGLTGAFLMFVFQRVNARSLPFQNLDKKMNHFIVPVIMLGIFSVFVETLFDQYTGPVEEIIRCKIKEESLKILLEVGPPMYLGFLIHVFLHFVILWTKLGKRPRDGEDSESMDSDSSYLSAESSLFLTCSSSLSEAS